MIRSAVTPPAFDKSPAAVLRAIAEVLVDHPTAALGDIAERIGIGRSTLHRLYPTRCALLQAVAMDAIGEMTEVYAESALHTAFTSQLDVDQSWAVFHRFVELMIPMGPRINFLLRIHELDHDQEIIESIDSLDSVLIDAIRRGQERGDLQAGQNARWIMEALHAILFIAWEHVHAGRLAKLDAPNLVIDTWMHGSSGVRGRT
ncbi:hypothetical protein [Arthrobacter flavus]|uniref:TetR/AcrR family transcriptional regulator n=1 Tax=Arthrobacter flavus TaxID=95172 RepID=A0ABW4Q7K3_9MICC